MVSVRADAVRRLENPAAYARVPRRVLGSDGRIRPWTAAAPITRGTHDPGKSPGKMTRSGDNAPSSGTPDTKRARCQGLLHHRLPRGLLRRERMPMTMHPTRSLPRVNEQPHSKSTCQGACQERDAPAHAE